MEKRTSPILLLACLFPPLATALGSVEHGDWVHTFGQGVDEYGTRSGDGGFVIACSGPDALAPDAPPSIYLLDWTQPTAEMPITIQVDGVAWKFQSDAQSNLDMDSPATRRQFGQLWQALRAGNELRVATADGATNTFSLRGSARALPPEPCQQ